MKKLTISAGIRAATLSSVATLGLWLGGGVTGRVAGADVGIGTETPLARLHIAGEAAGLGTDLRVDNLDPPQDSDVIKVLVTDQDGNFHTATLESLALALAGGGGSAAGNDDDWRSSNPSADLTIDQAIYTNNRIGVNIQVPAYEVDIDGDLRATGSLFAANHIITHATFATSDARFKRDIEPYTNGLAQIRALLPRRFRYTEDAPVARPDRVYYGLIAQEAAAVDPSLVETFVLPAQHAGAAKSSTPYLGVDSQRLIFTLLSAVKELDHKNQEIDALKARLDALEARANATAAVQGETRSDLTEFPPKPSPTTAAVANPGLILRPDHPTQLAAEAGTAPATMQATNAPLSPDPHISNSGGTFQ